MGTSARTKGGTNQGSGSAGSGRSMKGAQTMAKGGIMKVPKGGNGKGGK